MQKFKSLTWDFQVVHRIAGDCTMPSKTSWERSELKTAGGLSPPENLCVCLLQHISGFHVRHFLAKKFAIKEGHVLKDFIRTNYATYKQGILKH